MEINVTYCTNSKAYLYTITQNKLIEKMENWKKTYSRSNEKEKTSIFCFYNEENKLEKIHIQNYSKLKFSHEFKIEYSLEWSFNILKTKIQWQDIEKLLEGLTSDNIISNHFVTCILNRCKMLEK